MLELNVNTRSPAAITAAFKKIKEMTSTGAVSKTTPVHITLESGVYREIIRYNMSNPLIMEAAPGVKAEDCVIQAENCESFHSGVENRALFAFGPNVTKVILKNFSVINTHNKSVNEGSPLLDAAEAFFWNNTTGSLRAEGMHFESRMNTLALKGFTHFVDCYISGDTDFIYGDVDTALFENCDIFVREDNRGDYPGYAVKSMALANKTGFLFTSCRFTGDKRKKNSIYIARTMGKGSISMPKFWDSIAIINCQISEIFNPELIWDDDMTLEVYPRGNAKVGLREYKTLTILKGGKTEAADTSRRNLKSYTLTDDDYYKSYASRFLMLQGTPLEECYE